MCGAFARGFWRRVGMDWLYKKILLQSKVFGSQKLGTCFHLPGFFSDTNTHDQVPVEWRAWDKSRGGCLGRGKRLLLWHLSDILFQSELGTLRYGVCPPPEDVPMIA